MNNSATPKWCAVCLCTLIVLSRLFYIEADIPVWDLSYYKPIDELYYSLFSFTNSADSSYSTAFVANPAQVLLTKLTLSAFGNNYYGLRLPSVIFSCVGFFLLSSVFYRRFSWFGVSAFATFFLVDFSCILMSRVAEPTTSRFFAMALAIFLTTKSSGDAERSGFDRSMLLGAASVLLFLLFYPTNAFVTLGVVVCAAMFSSREQKINVAVRVIFGSVLGFVVYLGIMYSLGYLPDIKDLAYVSQGYGARVVDTGSGVWHFLRMSLGNLYRIKDANFFRLNVGFTASLFLICLTCLWSLFKNKRRNDSAAYKFTFEDTVMSVFFICFVLQALLVNDYPQRKLVIILPFFVYLFVFCWESVVNYSAIRNPGILCMTLFLCSIVPHAVFSYENIYSFPTYTYKQSMQALSSLGDARLVGGWSIGFRLYNRTKPYLNQYSYNYDKTRRDIYDREIGRAVTGGYATGSLDYFDEKTLKFYRSLGLAPGPVVYFSRDPKYPSVCIYVKDIRKI